jgi:hypothetical protein
MIKTILKFGLAGALLAAIAAFFMFGGKGPEGNRSGELLVLMVPTFALVGAILGALNGLLFAIVRRSKR